MVQRPVREFDQGAFEHTLWLASELLGGGRRTPESRRWPDHSRQLARVEDVS